VILKKKNFKSPYLRIGNSRKLLPFSLHRV